MKTKWLPIAVAVVSALSAQAAVSAEAAGFDYYGYFRSGVGTGDDGSMKDAVGGSFQKNKLGRLGNEFDTYAEVGFGKELKSDDSKSVYIQTMFNMYDGDTNSNMGDSNFGWENLNMQLRNFMGMGETSWVGIRQYKKDFVIDSNDFFYWNQTNVGGGIEDMQLGQGKLSVAALHRDIADTYNNSVGEPIEDMIDSNQLDLLYTNLPLWDGATLAMGYKFLKADATAEQIDADQGNHEYADGHAVMLELNQSLLGTGWNKTTLQYYADGSALQGVLFGAADTLNGTVESGNGFAIRNYGSIPLGADWDLSHAINYAEANDIKQWDGVEGDVTAFAMNAKVTYHWSDITRTYVEAGYFDDEKTENGDQGSRSGSKYTLAQAFSLGRGEPELRVFASYLDSDNSDWDGSHSFDNGTADDTWTVGLQANVWW
ncbi:carbohydrate porin [Aeromonas lusitana]|uniref:Carbohydrate porin n=1 Tax=Aeromonas lusitana TaxID=931529 RepID=A0A2M8H482_9GAMM|nr:carbohydrate porin [Aeromonas lusitana]PJC91372.1 carbohydrate porin [Aeromonas lusitana]